jgi:predicted nucleotidyltransferase
LLAKDLAEQMLTAVAKGLGSQLLPAVAFVGGCTTALHVTDELALQSMRFTVDVDLIVRIMSKSHWHEIQSQLRERGFGESINDDVICRMRLGELKVDFMPDDASILGFTNRWYRTAVESAQYIELSSGVSIRVVDPAHFIATKLEAYKGRGKRDPLSSHDIEDILTVVDGRPELADDILASDSLLRAYIAEQLANLTQMQFQTKNVWY